MASYTPDVPAGRRVGSERVPFASEETLSPDIAQLVQRVYDDASSFIFAECNATIKALSFTEGYDDVSFLLQSCHLHCLLS